MALNIKTAADPIEVTQLVTLFYGDPGVGKTSLAFTAENTLLLDFDGGVHRSAYREDHVPIKEWEDVDGMTKSDLAPYSTIAVDTLGKCLDCLARDIMAKNSKMRGVGGALSLQGYGALGSAFSSWLSKVRSMGKDVVLLAHASEESGDAGSVFRPSMLGKKSVNTVYQDSDLIGYIHSVEGVWTIELGQSERWVSKAPPEIGALPIENRMREDIEGSMLARLLAEVKGILNSHAEGSRELAAFVTQEAAVIKNVETAEAATKALAHINGMEDDRATRQLKPILWAHAKEIGLKWDAEAEEFTGTAA